jgi:hypothetical protein
MVRDDDEKRSSHDGSNFDARTSIPDDDENTPLLCGFKLRCLPQTYARKLGVFSSTINLQDGDLYLRQENGQIEMKTRFALVLATMRDFKRISSQEFKASSTDASHTNTTPR